MVSFPKADNEMQRLAALRDLGIFSAETDPAVAKIASLASSIFGATAFVTLVEEKSACIKSASDEMLTIIDRASVLCNWSIMSDDVLVVGNALTDCRFADLPCVRSKPGVRFYAGAPLIVGPGLRVGALCLTSTTPRHLSSEEIRQLSEFADIVVSLMRIQQARMAQQTASIRLRESEARFRHLVENGSVMAWVTESDGRCSYVSDSWYAFTGQAPGTALGQGWLDLVHPDERATVTQLFSDANARQAPFKCETRIRHCDGSYRWVIDTALPRFDDETREFLGYVGSVIDINDQKETEAALRASESRLSLAISATNIGIWEVDLATKQRRWSLEIKAMLGLPDDVEPSRELFLERLHPDDRALLANEPNVALPNDGRCNRNILRIQRADNGEERWVEVMGQTVFDDALHRVRMLGTIQDITERKQAEDAIRASEERLRLALQSGRMYAWERGLTNNFVERSYGALDVIGMGSGPSKDFIDRIHPDDRERAAEIGRAEWGLHGRPTEFRFIKPDGEMIWLSGCTTVYREANRADRLIGVAYDITDRKAAEEDLWRSANQDPLTELPNRALFQNRLCFALADAETSNRSVTLFVIDLDDFKDVNDTLGHDAGDALLVETAKRLVALAGPDDTVARLGGDEFAVIATDSPSEHHVSAFKAELMSSLRAPFVFGDRVLACNASVGVAEFPQHHRDMRELLKDADIALYRAKHDGRNRMVTYEPDMRADTELRVSIGTQVRAAISANEIIPYYQPKVCLSTGNIVGFEALARWHHPAKGLLTPGYFGMAFDNAELASAIGQQMLKKIVEDMGTWKSSGLGFGQVAINLSPTEFADPRLAANLFATLNNAGLEPGLIEVEVTETAFIGRRAEAITAILEELHCGGITIALDDFGTGSASLTHLKQFPVDHIKIDRSFIMGLERAGDDAAIVKAIVRLGTDLGMSVTAEGVENDGQEQHLAQLGCNYAQGYLFARPMAASRVPWFIRSWHQNADKGRVIDTAVA